MIFIFLRHLKTSTSLFLYCASPNKSMTYYAWCGSKHPLSMMRSQALSPAREPIGFCVSNLPAWLKPTNSVLAMWTGSLGMPFKAAFSSPPFNSMRTGKFRCNRVVRWLHVVPGHAAYAARRALGVSKEFLSLLVFFEFREKIPFP